METQRALGIGRACALRARRLLLEGDHAAAAVDLEHAERRGAPPRGTGRAATVTSAPDSSWKASIWLMSIR